MLVKMSISTNKQLRCLLALRALNEIKKNTSKEVKRKHRFWVNPFLQLRELHSMEAHLLKDVLWEGGNDYTNFCRLTIVQFEAVLRQVEPKIEKQDTVMRHAISSRVRLAVTLRYVATGDSYRSLEFLSRISRKTISKFVPEVLKSIIDALQHEYLKTPSTDKEWTLVANDFDRLWDFPNTLGSVDGKHIRIKAPLHSGSDFYNYRGFFSIVLLAVVDAHSRFIYIDVGGNGRASDVIIYKNSSLYQGLTSGKLNIPQARQLKGQECKTPFYFIGDDIFGLDRNFMKAYSRSLNLDTRQEIFNYRLSRARLTVEMAFGRLASRFRIFHRPIEIALDNCDILVTACCVLHNYLSSKLQAPENPEKENHNITLPVTITSLTTTQDHNRYKYACQIRDNLSSYCVTSGDVPYQWNKIKKQQIH